MKDLPVDGQKESLWKPRKQSYDGIAGYLARSCDEDVLVWADALKKNLATLALSSSIRWKTLRGSPLSACGVRTALVLPTQKGDAVYTELRRCSRDALAVGHFAQTFGWSRAEPFLSFRLSFLQSLFPSNCEFLRGSKKVFYRTETIFMKGMQMNREERRLWKGRQ